MLEDANQIRASSGTDINIVSSWLALWFMHYRCLVYSEQLIINCIFMFVDIVSSVPVKLQSMSIMVPVHIRCI